MLRGPGSIQHRIIDPDPDPDFDFDFDFDTGSDHDRTDRQPLHGGDA
ncbi:MAG: hypothetical protein ACOX52_23240 [Verrucomicrobiota bacterium]